MRPHPAHKFATLSFQKKRVQESAPFTKSHSSLRLPLLSEGEGWGEVLLPPRKSQRGWMLGGFLLILLLLTGCGDDRPYTGPPPGASSQAQTAPRPTLPDPAASSTSASGTPADPLIGSTPQTAADPLIGHDPLQGRAMPTAHSHWLRGHLREGRLTVLLNGVRYRSFSGAVDQDITMQLRPGANTVTFLFQPNAAGASADMEVLESEHDPPIPPLVTFQAAASEPGGQTPVTKTFPFIAH